MEDILSDCTDCHIVCQDLYTVPANAFTMLSTCKILRDLHGDLGEKKEFHVPNVLKKDMKVFVGVIHGILDIKTLDMQQVTAVIHTCALLGCDLHARHLVQRLWNHLRKVTCMETLFQHADTFLYDTQYRREYLSKLKLICPRWGQCKLVLGHVQMSEKLAMFLIPYWARYYPAIWVMLDIIDAFPPSVSTRNICENLLNIWNIGNYFHPIEMTILLKHLSGRIPVFQTIVSASDMFDSLPLTKITGSYIVLTEKTRSSVLLQLHGPLGRATKRVRVQTGISLSIDPVSGYIDGALNRYGICNVDVLNASSLHCRLLVYSSGSESYDSIQSKYTVDEAWRSITNLSPTDGHMNLGAPTDIENEKAIAHAVTSRTCRFIRVDLFWGSNPRTTPY